MMEERKMMRMTTCGGCMAKLPQGMLREAVEGIPRFSDENLLVGYDTSDDGAVYKLSEDIAIIQTLDFFTPMVDDAYTFGKIAAANALSDVYAMGGEVVTALNIVCFPEQEDAVVLAEILRGGAEKVKEAGGVLCGGHSINDHEIKYGMSVTGRVHPSKFKSNNTCKIGDVIVLTKPLGVGMVVAAYKHGEVSEEDYAMAVESMQLLNKYAFEAVGGEAINAITDVTGFGFLGHLNEMVSEEYTIEVESEKIPYIAGAKRLAEELLVTGGGQKNRNFLNGKVEFNKVPDYLQEILFDPQTSGGLLMSIPSEEAANVMERLQKMTNLSKNSQIVGRVIPRQNIGIIVK